MDQPRENDWYMYTHYEPCSGSKHGIPCTQAIIRFADHYRPVFRTFVVGFSELLGDPRYRSVMDICPLAKKKFCHRYRGKAKKEFEYTNVVLLKREENEG